ncbi:MAG: hypothetical protein HQL38_01320 [Alphaproteobacteria bacterium]|nr:hypothetical protein [Alphaproteobacteria bacterium]
MPFRLTPNGPAEPRFAPADPDLRAALLAAVKAEAARRILATAPEWKQRNATARAVELIRKGESAWTPDEVAESAAIDLLWSRVKAIRAASDHMEAGLVAAAPEALGSFDIGAGWP